MMRLMPYLFKAHQILGSLLYPTWVLFGPVSAVDLSTAWSCLFDIDGPSGF